MSLTKDDQDRWVIRWFEDGSRSGTYRQKTLKKGTTKRAAEQEERKVLVERDRKRRRRRRGFELRELTLAEAARQRLEEKRKSKPDSLKRHETSLESHIIPALGDILLSELDERQVVNYLLTRKADGGIADGTVIREWADLKSVLHWAERWKILGDFSIQTVNEEVKSHFDTSSPREAVFTPELWRRFLTAFEEQDWNAYLERKREENLFRKTRSGSRGRPGSPSSNARRRRCAAILPVFRMLLYTGSRMEEVLSLTWDAVDFRTDTLTIYQFKTKKRKLLPLSDGIRSVLEEAGPRRLGKSPLLRHASGKKFTSGEVREVFNKALEVIGEEEGDLVPHSIRHTVTTWLAKAGVTLEVREAILGHSVKARTGSMTVDYTHTGPEDLLSACNLISQIEANGFQRPAAIASSSMSAMSDAEIRGLIERLEKEVTSRSRFAAE